MKRYEEINAACDSMIKALAGSGFDVDTAQSALLLAAAKISFKAGQPADVLAHKARQVREAFDVRAAERAKA